MQEIWPEVVGSYGAGEHNEKCVKLLQFCAINNLFIANTIFKHKERRRYTWTSPKRTEMQIDFIIMSEKLKSSLKNCRTYKKLCRNRIRSLTFHCKLSFEKTKQNETYKHKKNHQTL